MTKRTIYVALGSKGLILNLILFQDEEEGFTSSRRPVSGTSLLSSRPIATNRGPSSEADRPHRKSFDSFFTARRSASPNPELVRRVSESHIQPKVPSPVAESFRKSGDHFVAKSKSSSGEFHFPAPKEPSGDENSVLSKSAEQSSTVYDPGCNSFIPRDPECPIHSPKHGSLRSSPARSVPTTPVRCGPQTPASRSVPTTPIRSAPTTPVRESPPRPTSFDRRSSPVRASPTRYSAVRVPSSGRLSNQCPTPPLLASPTRMLEDSMKMEEPSRKTNGSSPVAGATPRSSAAESELLHCTICTQQFDNPKVGDNHGVIIIFS